MQTPVPIDHAESARLDDALSSMPYDAPLPSLRSGQAAARPDASLDARQGKGTSFVTGLLLGVVMVVLALGAVVIPRLVAPSRAPVPSTASAATMEEAFLLRCVPPEEMAALIRPLLRDPVSTIVISPRAPRVITVRTTSEGMQRVRATIHRYEEGDAAACARQAPPAPQ